MFRSVEETSGKTSGKEKKVQLEHVRDSFCLLYHHFLAVLTEEILMHHGDSCKSVISLKKISIKTPDGLHAIEPDMGKWDVSLYMDPMSLPKPYLLTLTLLRLVFILLSFLCIKTGCPAHVHRPRR